MLKNMKTNRATATGVPQPTWAARWHRVSDLLLLTLPVAGQAQFDYTTDNGTITITRYNCTAGAATIPSTINGLPVTTLGDRTFDGCTGLTSVTIPNRITTLGGFAFAGCTGLTSVYFLGNAPNASRNIFLLAPAVTIYFLAGAAGWDPRWGATYAERPARF